MSLRLTSKLRARLACASEALLTPPEQGRLAAWRDAARASLGELLAADAVALRLPEHVLPPDGRDDVPPPLELAYGRAADRPGRAVALGRVPPHGAFMAALITPTPRHVAGLLWNRQQPHPRLPPEGEVELLRLIYPAFKAGVTACIESTQRRPLLCAALNSLAEAAALVDGRGRTLHRNRALQELLAGEVEPDRLQWAAEELAGELRRRSAPTPARAGGARRPEPAPTCSAEVETAAGEYRLFATQLETAAGGPGAILLVIQPCSPRLPPPASLRRRFGLSRREAEVALLLAQGRRNSHVAQSLGISPHTARHHTEMVLAKLGSSSRAEVGAVLLRA